MSSNQESKTILIAPLNWGLGHATRCIPIIKALQERNYIPIIASDGEALALLQKEFPTVLCLTLPSYQIEYAKNGQNFKWKLIKSVPKILKAIREEEKQIELWLNEYAIDGLISDNRLGVFSKKIPSVYLTHQLNVLTGNTTRISSYLHQHFIKKHTECWIPDFEGAINLTGQLGHCKASNLNLKYIGPLSRLSQKAVPKQYDLMILLSGPEPQRGLLEEHLKKEVLNYKGKIVFIKGVIQEKQKKEQINNVCYYNFMTSKELEQTFNESEIVLCRSGYTTIMDLTQLRKKAFFIPTPGQYEQAYLAKKCKVELLVPYVKQECFRIEHLDEIGKYKGLSYCETTINWNEIFKVFYL